MKKALKIGGVVFLVIFLGFMALIVKIGVELAKEDEERYADYWNEKEAGYFSSFR